MSTYGCCDATSFSWSTTTALVSKFPRSLASWTPDTTIAELQEDAWDNVSQDDIWHLYDHLPVRIHACIAARGGYKLCIDVIIWTPLTVTVFMWSEFIMIYSYNDKLPVTLIFNTMNLSLRVLHFFSGTVFKSVEETSLRKVLFQPYPNKETNIPVSILRLKLND